MNVLVTLVKREFWEHRALWLVPLLIGVAIVVLAAFEGVHVGDRVNISIDLDSSVAASDLEPQERAALQSLTELPANKKQTIYLMTLVTFLTVHMLAIGIVVFFYLLDSLYSERKDRSILFWKSLPVSDGVTVLSKGLVGLLIAPLLAIAMAALTQIVFGGIWALKFGGSSIGSVMPAWDTAVWLKFQGLTLLAFCVGALWYAPIAGYLLLVSAWARRNVFLWAVMPPVLLAVGEKLLMGSDYIGEFIGRRMLGVAEIFSVDARYSSADAGEFGAAAVQPIDRALAAIDPAGFFLTPDLWLGLAAAALLVFAAVRIRRYRDDT